MQPVQVSQATDLDSSASFSQTQQCLHLQILLRIDLQSSFFIPENLYILALYTSSIQILYDYRQDLTQSQQSK